MLDRVDAALDAEGIPTETLRAARGAEATDPLAHAELARALHGAGPVLVRGAPGARALPAHRGSRRRARPRARSRAALLREAAEIELAEPLVARRAAHRRGRGGRDFATGAAAAAELAPAIDRFFTDVMVMDDDPAVRANRLRLMVDVVEATRPIGDLSMLPG